MSDAVLSPAPARLVLADAVPGARGGDAGLIVAGPGLASGGYIVGFVLAAGVTGWAAEHGGDRRVLRAFATFVAGQLVVFGIGVPWLMVATDQTAGRALHDGFAILTIGGLIKALIAALAIPSAWRLVRRIDERRWPAGLRSGPCRSACTSPSPTTRTP